MDLDIGQLAREFDGLPMAAAIAKAERLIAALDGKEVDKWLGPHLDGPKVLSKIKELRNWKPRGYQQPLWDYLEGGGKRACVIWHRRCLAQGTFVAKANGEWVAIETLKIGDEILSWHDDGIGNDRVIGKWATGEKQVTAYQANGYPEIESTANHLFRTFGSTSWEHLGWIPADLCANKNGVAIGQYARGIPGSLIAGDVAELLGYLLTDGYVTHGQQPKFTNTDRRLIDRVAILAQDLF